MTELSASTVIERLCNLSEEVHDHLDAHDASDCFCRSGGFWKTIEGYGGTYEEGYRNDGEVLQFMEDVVRAAIYSGTR